MLNYQHKLFLEIGMLNFSTLGTASSIERFAIEIRHLQKDRSVRRGIFWKKTEGIICNAAQKIQFKEN